MPAKIQQCPHCEHQLAGAGGRGRGLATKLGVSLLVSSTAMTLMACYGAPGGYCDYDPACDGYGSWSDSGTSGDEGWSDDDDDDDGDDGGWEDSGDTGEPEEDDEGEEEDSDTDGEEAEQCATSSQRELIEDQDLPVVVTGELELGSGTSQGTCGGSGNEQIYLWKPPTTDGYLVALKSPADLVVYARIPDGDYGGSCGEEIGCAAHPEGAVGQRLRLGLEELGGGEPILLIVDGATPEQAGPFTLTIDPL